MNNRAKTRFSEERGFTLIELTIVILIIGLVMGTAIPAVSNITRANLKIAASKIAGSIRFGYDLAARKNVPFRMVFDLEEKAFWIESSSDQFLLDREKDEVHDGTARAKGAEERAQRFVTRSFIESGDMWKPKGPSSFSKFAGALTPKIELPNEIRFQDVWVGHQSERATAGAAYLYFFPTGMTERAVIHLADDDENVYSLSVDALTGRVRVFPHFVEGPEE